MPLTEAEAKELASLEAELSAKSPSSEAAPESPKVNTVARATQGLPRSLAFGTGFKAATDNLGSAGDLDKGAYIAGGEITDLTGSPALGTAVRMLPDIASILAGGGWGTRAAPVMRAGAEKMMRSAINPSAADAMAGKADRAAKTFLDEGLNPSVSGIQKLREAGTDLNNQVYSLLEQSGKTINRPIVGAYIQDVLKRVSKNEFSQDAIKATERVYDQLLTNPLLPKNVPASQAQEIKQAIYFDLKKKYGQLGTDTEESMKAVARGYKTEIEKAVPEVIPLNAKASDIWNAISVSERKAYMALTSHPNAISFLAHRPELAAAYLASKSAMFKSLVARAMNASKTDVPVTAGALTGLAASEIPVNKQ